MVKASLFPLCVHNMVPPIETPVFPNLRWGSVWFVSSRVPTRFVAKMNQKLRSDSVMSDIPEILSVENVSTNQNSVGGSTTNAKARAAENTNA